MVKRKRDEEVIHNIIEKFVNSFMMVLWKA